MQAILSAAWDFRQRMKKDLPNNRIINVFHLEDGMKGLDRMIEFAEYDDEFDDDFFEDEDDDDAEDEKEAPKTKEEK